MTTCSENTAPDNGPAWPSLPELLLPAEDRIAMLQAALDTLTIRIADPKKLFCPSETQIRLLQDQVRLIGSQIRSYEKLEQLKKDMGMIVKTAAEKIADENQETMFAAAAEKTGATLSENAPEKKSVPAAEPSSIIDQAIKDLQAGKKTPPPPVGEVAHADKHATEGVLTRAERRRLKRAEKKNGQKNKSALMNGVNASTQPAPEPATMA